MIVELVELLLSSHEETVSEAYDIGTSSTISQVVNKALNQGFQVSPEAIKLLKILLERNFSLKSKTPEPNLISILNFVIEGKTRREFIKHGRSTSSISKEDLVEFLPDIFADLIPLNPSEKSSSAGIRPSIADMKSEVEVLQNFAEKTRPTGTENFSGLFKSRYEKIIRILNERPEGRQLVKLSSVSNIDKGTTRVAGLVFSKRQTKKGVEVTLDDDTGKLTIVAIGERVKDASEIALDQCVMFELESKQGRFLVKSITQPDIPNHVPTVSKKTAYAVFISDLHIGSDKFLESAFNRFLDWLSGRSRFQEIDEEIIRRLKYIVIGGDVVDGVGIFPSQEFELAESDIYKQYRMVYEKVACIPSHLQVLVIPGNHDSTRQALPQPMIPRKYAESLYSLPNVMMLGDPGVVRLHGVSVMVFHGRSLDDILATTPGLTYEKPTDAMKVLLKARHLAPIFGQRTPIAPEAEDHLVIEQVPDIFHAGHVHSVGVESYKGTLMINSGTFQAQTGYQANLGIMPRPGLVPVVNLATLEVILREFLVSEPNSVLA